MVCEENGAAIVYASRKQRLVKSAIVMNSETNDIIKRKGVF